MKNVVLFFCCCLSVQAIAQTRLVTGAVVDNRNDPLIGVTVVEEGTTNGTISGVDGEFSISVSGAQSTLTVNFLGYKPLSVTVGNQTRLNVVLEEASTVLDDVVVTGYSGMQIRGKLTSSVSRVAPETFDVGLYSNPAQALSGAVPGIRVIQSSGNPGATPAIILRGGTNLDGSGSPLVVVDGQVRGGLQDINPEDIESMDVLKDAGATAIYGARASNGVVLITTKTGKSGRAQINLKAKMGLNYLNSPYEFLEARDYLYYMRRAHQIANDLGWGPNNLAAQQPYGTGNTYGVSPWSTMYMTPENEYLLGKG